MVKAECYMSRGEYDDWTNIGIFIDGRILLDIEEKPLFFTRKSRISNGRYFLAIDPESFNRHKRYQGAMVKGDKELGLAAYGTVEKIEVDLEESLISGLEELFNEKNKKLLDKEGHYVCEVKDGNPLKTVPEIIHEAEDEILEILKKNDEHFGRR